MTFIYEIISKEDREKYNLDTLIEDQKNLIKTVFEYGDRGIYKYEQNYSYWIIDRDLDIFLTQLGKEVEVDKSQTNLCQTGVNLFLLNLNKDAFLIGLKFSTEQQSGNGENPPVAVCQLAGRSYSKLPSQDVLTILKKALEVEMVYGVFKQVKGSKVELRLGNGAKL